MTQKQRKVLAAILVPIDVVLAVLAWRDLAKRPDVQVRVNKKFWRSFMLLNPGNSLFYWLFGRR